MTHDSLFSWLVWSLAFSVWLILILSLCFHTKGSESSSDVECCQDLTLQLPKEEQPVVDLLVALKIGACSIIMSGLIFLAYAWHPILEVGYIANFLCLASFLALCLGTVAMAVFTPIVQTDHSIPSPLASTLTSNDNQNSKPN